MTSTLPPLPPWFRGVAAALFVALLGEAVLLSPPSAEGTGTVVMDWMTGNWSGYEPLNIVHFQLMGVWPVVMAAMCAPWLRGRPIPLWPFAVASMALGGFVLLPGLALPRTPGKPVRVLSRRWIAPLLALPTVLLLGWAVMAGDASVWWHAYQTEQLTHVMAWDFVALWLMSIAVAQVRDGRGWVCGLPMLGALMWLWTRSSREA